MKVIFSAQARGGLRDIGVYIAKENRGRAATFVRELQKKALALADTPYAFPLIPRHEHHGIRRRIHGNYLILYRVDDERISIIHILHAARDYEALLFPDD